MVSRWPIARIRSTCAESSLRLSFTSISLSIGLFGLLIFCLICCTDNSLIESVRDLIGEIADPKRYIGLSVEQTDAFLRKQVQPLLKANKDLLGLKGAVNV